MLLPIDPFLPSIDKLLTERQNVLVQSSPGSGKTTRIPPYLGKRYKKILVVEPRRIAAIYAASRIAEESNWEVGQQVGYEVRFESKRSTLTSILFLTEALLAKKIVSDPQLQGIDLIIFDEFHERSIWTDLSIGHLKELQILGSNIQLLFLSATIDKAPLMSFFEDIGVVDVELPRFPIEIIYQKKPLRYLWSSEFETNLLSALQEIIQKGKKQVLVFLPGTREIRNAVRALESSTKFKGFEIQILHGSIPLSEQKSIVMNEKNTQQRIILSTNLAESSLTISGVTAVLDSGLHREATYNSDYEVSQLNTRKISLFSAIQRQGRANRLGPGICFKMWTELDERSMEKAPVADIKTSSLFDLGLHLVQLGHWPMNQFTWFESPMAQTLTELQKTFLDYGLCQDKKLTPLGQLALDLNLSYENVLFFILSHVYLSIDTASLVIAILESDISSSDNARVSNSTLMDQYEDFSRGKNIPFPVTKRVSQLINSFEKSKTKYDWASELRLLFPLESHKNLFKLFSKKSESTLDMILCFSYLNRICRRRKQESQPSNRAITTRGKEVQVGEPSKANLLPPLEYFLNFNTIIDAQQVARCFEYHFIAEDIFEVSVKPFCELVSRVEFSEAKQQFYKITELMLRKLTIETVKTEPLGDKELKEKTKEILSGQKEALIFNLPAIEEFQVRLTLINSIQSDPIVIDWNEIIEEEIKRGLTLKNRQEWEFEVESYLPYEMQKLLKSLAPKELTIKNSTRIFRIHYAKNETPSIEAKLQNFLGLSTHPTILGTQLKLKVILLGPHGRPIQITNDLPSFWKTSYPEIRKEMKGRYPKHAWPEDPTS